MIVALDATENYSPEVVDKCGRIADVYYYNANEVTHFCEFTPSYWLEYVTSYAEKSSEDELEQENIYNTLQTANLFSEGMPVHCHQLDKHPRVKLLDDFSEHTENEYYDLDNFIRQWCRPDEFWSPDFLPF